MKKHLLFTTFFVITHAILAQNDSIRTVLKEIIVVADKKIENSKGYKIQVLNDSIITKNTESFTSLLRFNSLIYLKEYGSGGTSTASFRGTSSSNTAVIWNGININSVNNGQTGFNSLTVSLFDAIDVRSGGGSIEYGSGAVGGTIHLNDQLLYKSKKVIVNQFVGSIGSFSTYNTLYKFKLSTEKLALKLGMSYNESENDYKLLGTDLKNFNGAYNNFNMSIGLAYKFNPKSQLKFYSTSYVGKRLFSGELPNPSGANDKYKDFNNRNLLVYNYQNNKFNHELKLAFLTQEYQFFDNKLVDDFNFGKSKRYLINYDVAYKISSINAKITSYSEYESVFGKTDQIREKNRRQFSQSFIYNQNILNTVFFDLKVRKDFNSDYNVPNSYSLGMKAKVLKNISLRANASKNYRVPTYNDLYWPGQGNVNLIPETAVQGEFAVIYKKKKFSADLGVFYISAKDKIVWTPNGDSSRPGIWTPINLSNVANKGVELSLSYAKNYNNHFIDFRANYSYTEAKDKDTQRFLIFVPKHLFNGSFGYSHKRISFFYQQLFTGEIFTTESNSKDFMLPSFFVGNLGGDYRITKNIKKEITIGFKINNVFDKNYVTQPRRPMPNRNFNLNINYKF
ncbi:TonB-dependent receptor domain-containing protein [Polaribacter sp. SA4-12]|uniref:TonB-dependent receptor domain-containing protein n=1 Tax=Polaribacter sp. SA4-12 TaxID=1312072 RepID=UPI000B3D1490|nr:TonB-dependent receptor [Polaribacter sp. SA4-12]ARV13900.1 TonB-dependent receptor [Polaribacter sp. SA4-12]